MSELGKQLLQVAACQNGEFGDTIYRHNKIQRKQYSSPIRIYNKK